ncbi:ABC transporter ATP-binding protein [Nocardioides zeae]|uniref:ABC transporter ATP-binding protein n=1 Tax=Nocardioides imazamoxiresistens TaxID=3231893 RepID=A0ABU3Q158_9ACTN|nr:ABC transporter ATP-binding protein [Nocardioides zeae]MDT9595243.1 ABC transporter ATP-binding protein [Nocardioides zeae]
MSVVEVDAVTVSLDGRPIVWDADLAVEPGEFVVLMGANGSGKSTLVRAMTGILPVSAGQVRVLGTPVERLRERHRIGYVPQRGGASTGVPASVGEVVASGRVSRRRLLRPTGAADRRAVAEALEVVGLADRARERVTSLSGGQQQRVLIARALAAEPEVLFLDEPTAGVDLPNQQALADTLERLSATGATIVLVAHELGTLAGLIDRCVVLRDGRIVYDGLPLSEVEVHGTPGVPLQVGDHRDHPAQHPGPHAGPHAGAHDAQHHDQHHPHDHHDHVDRPHEPGPHDCGPGHSDSAPDISGPFDRSHHERGSA